MTAARYLPLGGVSGHARKDQNVRKSRLHIFSPTAACGVALKNLHGLRTTAIQPNPEGRSPE
jgi:hypothetical protein